MQQSTFDAVDHGWVQPGLVCCPPQCNGLVRDPPEPYADVRQAGRKFGMELARSARARPRWSGAPRAHGRRCSVGGHRSPLPESLCDGIRPPGRLGPAGDHCRGQAHRRGRTAGSHRCRGAYRRRVSLRRVGDEEPLSAERLGSCGQAPDSLAYRKHVRDLAAFVWSEMLWTRRRPRQHRLKPGSAASCAFRPCAEEYPKAG